VHDDESVAMLTGDEAYGLSRALRTRDIVTGAPVGQYDYLIAHDEYGNNSYITALTVAQILFGPTPYSMRILNALLFLIAGILLFRMTRAAFGSLPAFVGLVTLLFLPTLFYWSISLLKEPLYLLGGTLVLTGVAASARAPGVRERMIASFATLAGLAVVTDLRQGAFALTVLGLVTGLAIALFFASSMRMRVATAAVAVLVLLVLGSQPSAQSRITSALEAAAKTHAGHVFTIGHSYKLLDDEFYVNPESAASSALTLTAGQAARYVLRAAASFIAVPLPWQAASARELLYLPEQMLWYVLLALAPVGAVAGWKRDPVTASLLAGFTLPTAAALALTNGNVGTLLRLRGTLIPYVVFLSATGFCAWLQRASARTTPA